MVGRRRALAELLLALPLTLEAGTAQGAVTALQGGGATRVYAKPASASSPIQRLGQGVWRGAPLPAHRLGEWRPSRPDGQGGGLDLSPGRPLAASHPAPEAAPVETSEGTPDPGTGAGIQKGENPFESVQSSEPAPAREHLNLVIAGDVVTGVGVGAFLLLAAGLVVRSNGANHASLAAQRGDDEGYRDATQRAELGETLAIVGGVSALVLITTGVVLIATGRRRERRRRESMNGGQLGAGAPQP